MNSNLPSATSRWPREAARERSLIDNGSRDRSDSHALARSFALPWRSLSMRNVSLSRRDETFFRATRTNHTMTKRGYYGRVLVVADAASSIRVPVSWWIGAKDRRKVGRSSSECSVPRSVASLFATHRYLDRSAGRCLRDWLLRLLSRGGSLTVPRSGSKQGHHRLRERSTRALACAFETAAGRAVSWTTEAPPVTEKTRAGRRGPTGLAPIAPRAIRWRDSRPPRDFRLPPTTFVYL